MKSFLEYVIESSTPPENIWSNKPWRDESGEYHEPKGLVPIQTPGDLAYRGLVAEIKPSMFLSLAAYARLEEKSINAIIEAIEAGYPIAPPWFDIDVDDDGDFRVVGHEGRHRAQAFKRLYGDQLIPVHIFLRKDGSKITNNRPDSDKYLQKLRMALVRDQDNSQYYFKPFINLSKG